MINPPSYPPQESQATLDQHIDFKTSSSKVSSGNHAAAVSSILALKAPVKYTRSAVPGGTTHPAFLSVHTETVEKLLKTQVSSEDTEDAFFVCDLGVVANQYAQWRILLPRIEPLYAVKCNPDPMMLAKLASLGTGFDCASKTEIQMALDQGVAPENVIYANPCKQASHIRFAAAQGVRMMTFDNADELHKIKAHHPNAQLILRILADDSRSLCKFGAKFGAAFATVPLLFKTAMDLGLEVVGVSFHVGSGCFDAAAFGDAVALAKKAFDVATSLGLKLSLLDVGGGFPGLYGKGVSFEAIAAVLGQAVDEYFPASSGIRVIAEPGRYFASSAYTLAVNVVARRSTVNPPSEDAPASFMYYVNDGMYGSFNCITFDHAIVEPRVLLKGGQFAYIAPNVRKQREEDNNGLEVQSKEPVYPASMWGPTCDSIDCIGRNFTLPLLDVGDWVYFDNMGAYTMSAASQFNGFKKSSILYTDTQSDS